MPRSAAARCPGASVVHPAQVAVAVPRSSRRPAASPETEAWSTWIVGVDGSTTVPRTNIFTVLLRCGLPADGGSRLLSSASPRDRPGSTAGGSSVHTAKARTAVRSTTAFQQKNRSRRSGPRRHARCRRRTGAAFFEAVGWWADGYCAHYRLASRRCGAGARCGTATPPADTAAPAVTREPTHRPPDARHAVRATARFSYAEHAPTVYFFLDAAGWPGWPSLGGDLRESAPGR